ncbi:FAD:protein FMN transferase, partial [Candidatus Dojkabacteria bacterium]|nr:FAD:protein FMN transferase [Candidatus Dojkabacteria bacterium]
KHRPSVFDIQFDFSKLAIKLAPKQRVDLGALGKGFAIRLARNHLLACGIENFLINAGGDIYAHGINQHNNLWTASLFDPNKSLTSSSYKDKGIVQLKNEALACSGGWARKVGAFHHLINPNTGDPIGTNKGQKVINSTEFNKTIYVKAKDPVIADAFATLCFLTPKIDTELLKKYSVTIL